MLELLAERFTLRIHVGGGFGVRGELYPEDVLVCVAAEKLNRPIKWIEDRREHLIAANHSRQQLHQIRAAVDADGVILAIDDRVLRRSGRLCAHRRGARRAHDGRHLAGAVSGAGVSFYRPFPADQQNAGRDLSLARPLTSPLLCASGWWTRLRQGSCIDRIEIRRRNAITACRDALSRDRSKPWARKSITTPAIISGCWISCSHTIGWDALNAEVKKRQAAGELVGIGGGDVRREKRARADRRRQYFNRHSRAWSKWSPAAPRSARVLRR